jgi:HNH endonuclease
MRKTVRGNAPDLQVDPEDEWLLSAYTWGISSTGHVRRAIREYGRQRIIYLHREIMGAGPGDPLVDHINGNPLDNRRSNLRFADKSINRINSDKVRSDSGTGIKGVTFDARYGSFYVYIKRNGRKRHLGTFKTLGEAEAIAEDAYRR